MDHGDREFEQRINDLLKAHGLRFQGIRLKCRRCGEPGLAGSVKLAEMFGWMDLKQIDGPNYEGICIDCGHKPQE
jgi:hypothetical protein